MLIIFLELARLMCVENHIVICLAYRFCYEDCAERSTNRGMG